LRVRKEDKPARTSKELTRKGNSAIYTKKETLGKANGQG